MLLTGAEIKELNLVEPCVDKVKCEISYGLEPNGYTLRLDNIFKYPFKSHTVFDPMKKSFTNKSFREVKRDFFILKPNKFVLAKAKEYINLPNNVSAIALTKSTYARLGVFANITTIDAGWRGYLTIEIANLGSNPVKIYANYGIAEILFFKHNDTEGYDGNYQDLNSIKI